MKLPSKYEVRLLRVNETLVKHYEELERNREWADSNKDIMDKLVKLNKQQLEEVLKEVHT